VLPGGLLAIAAAAQVTRLALWKGWKAARDPLVLILHVGYAWVPIGLALLAVAQLGAALLSPRGACADCRAMGTMILA